MFLGGAKENFLETRGQNPSIGVTGEPHTYILCQNRDTVRSQMSGDW